MVILISNMENFKVHYCFCHTLEKEKGEKCVSELKWPVVEGYNSKYLS